MPSENPLPVLLVHGLIGSLDDPRIADAMPGREVFAPPLLGYGPYANAQQISLSAQVEHLSSLVAERFGTSPLHIAGHSVGGVVAALLTHKLGRQVASLISIEGNFTLRDAFWSASVGRMSSEEATQMLAGFRSDPVAWLARSGIVPNTEQLALAGHWLSLQPGATLRAMGSSIVETTGVPSYEVLLQEAFAQTPVHLIAGERSRAGWDVPDWALAQAQSMNIIPGTGHMMMLEDAAGFGRLIHQLISNHEGQR